MELIRDDVKVEWEDIGEGVNGDYNPKDPDDIPLLRFYVSVLRDGYWEEKEDASHCTLFPATANNEMQLAGLRVLMDRFYDVLHDNVDASVKKLGDEMSWISFESVMIADIKRQMKAHENETSYGEPQAWAYLDNGRSIEVTLEQHGLPEDDRFFSVRLHCNEQEFGNNDYQGSVGVIDQYTSSGKSPDELNSLIEAALACDAAHPVADHNLPEKEVPDVMAEKSSLADKISSAAARAASSKILSETPHKESER